MVNMEGIEIYPLTWPANWKRTPAHLRKSSRYKVSFARARDEVVRSLSLMNVRDYNVVISSNVPTRRDGLPYANMREPEDPGVACYWTKDSERRVIACDSWRTVRDNLRAVGLALEALRQLERTGASEILNRAFTGFAALPPAGGDWRNVLGLNGDVTIEQVELRYRTLAKMLHPDKGGSDEKMVALNKARDAALAFLRIG
jgi:hypothetical protein